MTELETANQRIAALETELAAMRATGEPVATVIKRGADRQWVSERLGPLPDGIYSLYIHHQPAAGPERVPSLRNREMHRVRHGG